MPGASAYFLSSTVVYTLKSRRQLLDMSDEDMKGIRSATEEYALLCTHSIHKTLGSTWALAETVPPVLPLTPIKTHPARLGLPLLGQ